MSSAPEWLVPDAIVTWLYTLRGGYGHTWPVDATVVRVHARRATIRVAKTTGGEVERVVAITSLRRR